MKNSLKIGNASLHDEVWDIITAADSVSYCCLMFLFIIYIKTRSLTMTYTSYMYPEQPLTYGVSVLPITETST